MVFVFLVLAIGLAIAARNSSGGTRLFLAICCAMNLAGIGKAIYTDDPYAYKLKPNPHAQIESERR